MTTKPKIAIILDENTSRGGDAYELPKNYINAIHQVGGVPYPLPYVDDHAATAVSMFDALLDVGGDIAFPESWLLAGQKNLYPASERLAVECKLMQAFFAARKPVLGICHGMQVMAGLHGCLLRSDLAETHRLKNEQTHDITILPDTKLSSITNISTMNVNSRHSQGIASLGPDVTASAHTADGVIEAIEITTHRFTIGLQWHAEAFWQHDHPSNRIFKAFVEAAAA